MWDVVGTFFAAAFWSHKNELAIALAVGSYFADSMGKRKPNEMFR